MKVLFYIHFLTIGGAETIVADYLINLKKKGVDVALVVIRHTDTFLEKRVRDAGVKMYALNEECKVRKFNGLKWRINRIFNVYKHKWESIIRIEKPDVLHMHTFIDTLKGVTFPCDRMVFTFHASVDRSLSLSSDENKRLLKEFTEKGMTFFALSDAAVKDIKRIYGTDKIIKIPNAVDIKNIRSSKLEKRLFLDKLDIPSDAFILGHVGRFHPVKNHEKIISVFREVNDINPNAYLLLIGGDVEHRMDQIRELVCDYKISDKVRFLGVCENTTAIVSIFDAFILPSYSESFSLATIEAEVLGKRCVVSDQVPKEVICNKNCFRLGINEPDEKWAELLLSDSVNDIENKLSDFDIENVIGRLVESYRHIVSIM